MLSIHQAAAIAARWHVKASLMRRHHYGLTAALELMREHDSFIGHYISQGYDPKYISDVVAHTRDGIEATKRIRFANAASGR